jgi:hypothetical protein
VAGALFSKFKQWLVFKNNNVVGILNGTSKKVGFMNLFYTSHFWFDIHFLVFSIHRLPSFLNKFPKGLNLGELSFYPTSSNGFEEASSQGSNPMGVGGSTGS